MKKLFQASKTSRLLLRHIWFKGYFMLQLHDYFTAVLTLPGELLLYTCPKLP